MDIDSQLQDVYIEVLFYGIQPEDKQAVGDIERSRLGAGQLIRALQIAHESLEIASQTADKETAESRMALAEKMMRSAMTDYRVLTTDETKKSMTRYFEQERSHFHKVSYINIAKGFLRKITPKSRTTTREKYTQLAMAELNAGLADPLADHDRIRTVKSIFKNLR